MPTIRSPGEKPTREELLRYMSASSTYGNLGLFVGTGFCKAALNDGTDEIALSWGQLLERAASQLEVDYHAIQKEGISYPEIASQICQAYAIGRQVSYSVATSVLKRAIASLTCWYPSREQRSKFGNYLGILSPAWIITTNYDLIIEGLLTGKSISLGPNDKLTHPRGFVPVYHLHGVRTYPEDIIITQEDYVSLFRPNEYRQIKLALAVKESTTLFIGYGLGDINVLTALDWSKTVFAGIPPFYADEYFDYPHEVIQILRKPKAKDAPYRDRNGILILETNELVNFFDEYTEVHAQETAKEAQIKKELDDLSRALTDPHRQEIERFIDDEDYRRQVIRSLAHFPPVLSSSFLSLLDHCIDETWRRSEPYGAFEGYSQNLSIILDILTLFEVGKIPPALFQTAAYGLERVGFYVGREIGKSWPAANLWESRKRELSKEMVNELRDVAEQHSYLNVTRLLADMAR